MIWSSRRAIALVRLPVVLWWSQGNPDASGAAQHASGTSDDSRQRSHARVVREQGWPPAGGGRERHWHVGRSSEEGEWAGPRKQ
jgi:hypothetical protein